MLQLWLPISHNSCRITVQRRNKWVCALKTALKECKIFGPPGDPNAPPDPTEYTLIPWDEVRAKKEEAAHPEQATREPLIPRGSYKLTDKNQIVLGQSQDVFGEGKELSMTAPKQTAGMRQRAAYLHGGGVVRSDSNTGRPTAEEAFQGQPPPTTDAAAFAAAEAMVMAKGEENRGDGN